MRRAKQVCKEMLIGLAIWVAGLGIILTILATHRIAAIGGTLVGGAVAAGIILHMYRHLDIALDMDAKHAQKHIQVAAFQRLFFMAAAVGGSFVLSDYIHPLGVILSLFGIKVTALLNPALHRYLT